MRRVVLRIMLPARIGQISVRIGFATRAEVEAQAAREKDRARVHQEIADILDELDDELGPSGVTIVRARGDA